MLSGVNSAYPCGMTASQDGRDKISNAFKASGRVALIGGGLPERCVSGLRQLCPRQMCRNQLHIPSFKKRDAQILNMHVPSFGFRKTSLDLWLVSIL